MTKSMTAFARSVFETETGTICWELKSLNHRYLELQIRLPDILRSSEMPLRERLQYNIARGKVEANCSFKPKTTSSSGIKVDSRRVEDVIAACNEIEALMGVGQTLNALDVLVQPGVIDDSSIEHSLDEQTLLQSLEKTIVQLNQQKQQEGERLEAMVLDRAKQLRNIVQTIRKRQPEVKTAIRQKLEKKLQELVENPDQERLEQELLYLAQKMDIDEELDRLVSHLVALQNAFSSDQSIGRRLDFLMQEFNREANTIASKSADAETTNAVVDMKVLIEQMREQVQNIE